MSTLRETILDTDLRREYIFSHNSRQAAKLAATYCLKKSPPMETTVTSQYDAYQQIHDLRVKEGEREITVMASMENGLVEFCYYNIKKWECHGDALTDEDRARLVARIIDHYIAQGWRVEVDRRRFCPRCHSLVDGSERSDWPGGECGFCREDLDRFGNIVACSSSAEENDGEKGWLRRLRDRFF